MSDEFTTWGKFETRSIVRDTVPVEVNYDPEIEKEMAGYTWGKFETRSIVRDKIPVRMHSVWPYLKITLALDPNAKLTYEQAMQHGEANLRAITAEAPIKLHYSAEHSKVEDGKLVAALVPDDVTDDTEWMLREYAEKLKDLPLCEVRLANAMAGEVEFLPVAKV